MVVVIQEGRSTADMKDKLLQNKGCDRAQYGGTISGWGDKMQKKTRDYDYGE